MLSGVEIPIPKYPFDNILVLEISISLLDVVVTPIPFPPIKLLILRSDSNLSIFILTPLPLVSKKLASPPVATVTISTVLR